MHNRREARETALKAIYAVEIGKNSTQDVTKNILKENLTDDIESIKFAEKLLLYTVDFAQEYDQLIEKHIKNWDMNRLAVMDKLILRMAITEFLHFDDVPAKVSINEAIELAKLYSTRKSGYFVNGILDAILNHLMEENRIKKKGRGLKQTSGLG